MADSRQISDGSSFSPAVRRALLQTWWNAEDKSEWRWKVEFSNHT
jgi:hypothetical protein